MAIVSLPPVGFDVVSSGMHPAIDGAKWYTHASDAGVSMLYPAYGGSSPGFGGVRCARSRFTISRLVWRNLPASPTAEAFEAAAKWVGVPALPCPTVAVWASMDVADTLSVPATTARVPTRAATVVALVPMENGQILFMVLLCTSSI